MLPSSVPVLKEMKFQGSLLLICAIEISLSQRKSTRFCLQVFQQLEEERICFLRNEMWVHTNILSQTYVDNDEVCSTERRDFVDVC